MLYHINQWTQFSVWCDCLMDRLPPLVMSVFARHLYWYDGYNGSLNVTARPLTKRRVLKVYSSCHYEIEYRRWHLRSAIRTGGAIRWSAVVKRSNGCSAYALAQPKLREAATSTDSGPQFTAPVFHFILATTILLMKLSVLSFFHNKLTLLSHTLGTLVVESERT